MEYSRLYASQKRLHKKSSFEYCFSKALRYTFCHNSVPSSTNFKEMNMHLTALLHNDGISQVLEIKHVFIGHTQVMVYLNMSDCKLWELRRNSASCAADDKAENW